MKTLQHTLTYIHPQMPLRIQRATGCSRKEAQALFNDLKAWLWLCGTHRKLTGENPTLRRELPDLRMLEHFLPLDIAWHEFILMTREYQAFCEKYLDGYIHHTPAALKENLKKGKGSQISDRLLQTYFEFIYDNLGEEILHRWTHQLPALEKK